MEAVEAAKQFGPEIILMDVGMPRLNGYEAVRRIREQPWGRDAIIIALTRPGKETLQRIVRMLMGLIKRNSTREYHKGSTGPISPNLTRTLNHDLLPNLTPHPALAHRPSWWRGTATDMCHTQNPVELVLTSIGESKGLALTCLAT